MRHHHIQEHACIIGKSSHEGDALSSPHQPSCICHPHATQMASTNPTTAAICRTWHGQHGLQAATSCHAPGPQHTQAAHSSSVPLGVKPNQNTMKMKYTLTAAALMSMPSEVVDGKRYRKFNCYSDGNGGGRFIQLHWLSLNLSRKAPLPIPLK